MPNDMSLTYTPSVGNIPWLTIRTSIGDQLQASAKALETACSSVRSATNTAALPGCSAASSSEGPRVRLQKSDTLAPSRKSKRAVTMPMPPLAPVTTMCLPDNSICPVGVKGSTPGARGSIQSWYLPMKPPCGRRCPSHSHPTAPRHGSRGGGASGKSDTRAHRRAFSPRTRGLVSRSPMFRSPQSRCQGSRPRGRAWFHCDAGSGPPRGSGHDTAPLAFETPACSMQTRGQLPSGAST